MAGSLTLQVVTPEKQVVQQLEIKSLIVPADNGYMGILPGHAPLVSTLRIGAVKFRESGSPSKWERMAITGGFLEVNNDQATLVVDAAERAVDIDVLRAKSAKERAEARLREKTALVDEARAELALMRAINRLRVAQNEDRKTH